MKSKSIYCVYCGEKNNIKDKKCKKCKKKLDPKENMILDYIKGKITGKVKGNIQEGILSFIKNLIISHFYGIVVTATLIFTIVSAIVTNNDETVITEVNDKPDILINNLNKCVIDNSKELIKICNEGYILDGSICKKEEEIGATVNNVCPNGYYAGGNTCISNENVTMLTRQECIAPAGDNVVGTKVENGQCWVNYCAGWTDGECSAGSMEPIEFTTITYCPTGTSLVDGVCKRFSNYNIEYSCSEGILSGDKCLITKEEESTLGCLEGYILNEECNLCVLGE